MVDIKKILYPTDFSEHSLVALPYSISLAGHYDAELHCLHVVDMARESWQRGSYLAMSHTPTQQELWDAAEKEMADFVAKHLADTKGVVAKTVSGHTCPEIVGYANEQQIDLVVIATHGHRTLATALLGSVTEDVIRKAPCVVLTVRHPKHAVNET